MLATLYSAHRGLYGLEISVLVEMHARIREARRRTGVSQEEFAAKLKVSRGAVGQWEMERGTTPSVKNLEQIAKLSGLAFEWVATGRGPMVFGEPMVKEPAADYRVALAPELIELLDIGRAIGAERVKALLVLLGKKAK